MIIPIQSRGAFNDYATRQVVGGLTCGMAHGMWTMMGEAIINAGESIVAGFFSPVVYIAATVLGGFANSNIHAAGKLPPADPIAIILGFMGHMMNSVVFALIFFPIVNWIAHNSTSRVIVGLIYGMAVFALMWYIVVPVVDPVALRINSLSFFVGHLTYGIGLGLTANRIYRV